MQQVFDFLTQPENGERVAGLIFAFLLMLSIISVLIYHLVNMTFNFFKTFISSLKRKERIVKVPEYITPPVNKEMDKYIDTLKKILDKHNDSIKL